MSPMGARRESSHPGMRMDTNIRVRCGEFLGGRKGMARSMDTAPSSRGLRQVPLKSDRSDQKHLRALELCLSPVRLMCPLLCACFSAPARIGYTIQSSRLYRQAFSDNSLVAFPRFGARRSACNLSSGPALRDEESATCSLALGQACGVRRLARPIWRPFRLFFRSVPLKCPCGLVVAVAAACQE